MVASTGSIDTALRPVALPGSVGPIEPAEPSGPPGPPTRDPAPGAKTRRGRRLWELPASCRCPLIGARLPHVVLRRIATRLLVQAPLDDAVELHVRAVHECGSSNAFTEALQHELERRHALAVHRLSARQGREALAAWWRDASQRGDAARAMWPVLTHPDCEAALLERVCRDVHALQHRAFDAPVQRSRALEQELREERHLRREMQGKSAARIAELEAQLEPAHADSRVTNARGNVRRDARACAATPLVPARPRRACPSGTPEHGAGGGIESAPLLDGMVVLGVDARGGELSRLRAFVEARGGCYVFRDGESGDGEAVLAAALDAAAQLVICLHRANHASEPGRRLMVLVDANVLIDIFTDDPQWLAWSAAQLASAAEVATSWQSTR